MFFSSPDQDHGHRVRLATHSNFKEFVLSAGLEFFPLGGDPKVLAEYMVKNKGFLPSAPSEISVQRKQIREIIFSLLAACKDPDVDSGIPFKADAIIANPPAYVRPIRVLASLISVCSDSLLADNSQATASGAPLAVVGGFQFSSRRTCLRGSSRCLKPPLAAAYLAGVFFPQSPESLAAVCSLAADRSWNYSVLAWNYIR
ncbi:Sterol 3-beta-glucosyltransferase UGT80A2 [Platanthera guangdongensis]|uniref:Sterol 3-beta-glucosyltransferase UGT80A2 n=1 Tax=Platanthera guangdongensis TaxID=2320717 RepID=A0ABR2MGS4_9ASPA